MNEKVYLIKESQIQALIAYLSQRPYSEVSQGIDGLRGLPLLNPSNEPDRKGSN